MIGYRFLSLAEEEMSEAAAACCIDFRLASFTLWKLMRFLLSRSHTIVDVQATGNPELPADYNLNRRL